MPHVRKYGFYPGKKFLQSALAYQQALNDAIAGRIPFEKALEISNAFQESLAAMKDKAPLRRDSGAEMSLQLFGS